MAGGAITLLYSGSVAAAVTITGPGTFTRVGVGAASFPETVSDDVTFTTTTDGVYTISVTVDGVEVADDDSTTRQITLSNGNTLVIDASPSALELISGLLKYKPVTATTTELEDIADAINTTDKYVGKMVFNTTTGIPVWADAATDDGTWSGADGAVDHTPV